MRGIDRLVRVRDDIGKSTDGIERAMPDRRRPDTARGQAQPSEENAEDDAENGH